MQRLLRLSIFVFIMLALAACSLLPKEEPVLAPPLVEPAQIQFATAEVERGEIAIRFHAVGSFYPLQFATVSASENRRLQQIFVKHRDIVKQGDLLAQLDVGALELQIEEQKFDLRRAEIEWLRAQKLEGDEFTVELAEMTYTQVQRQYDRLLAQLEDARLYAPLDGMVTYVTEKGEGEAVNAFESLVQLAALDELVLLNPTISLSGDRGSPSRLANDVKLGMSATVTLHSTGEVLTGRVAQTPSSIPQDMPPSSAEFFKDTIVVKVDELPEHVEIGDLAEFTIVLAQNEDATLIPRGALRSFMGRDYVQVKDGDSLREVDVETGIITSTQVEIRQGLEVGEHVIIR